VSASNWTKLKESTVSVNQDVLGVLDTTAIPDGTDVVIRLTAFDKAGNVREDFTTNKVINTAGYLLSGVSIDRDYVSSSGASISYRLNDNAFVTLKLKDSLNNEVTVINKSETAGYKSVPIASYIGGLSDGRVYFTISASISGKTNTLSEEFVLDRISPIVTLSDSYLITSQRKIDINGSIDDTNMDYYYVIIDGALTNTFFSSAIEKIASIELSDEKDYNIEVRAFDKAGNTSSKTLSVCIDRTSPLCWIESPTEGESVSRWLKIKGIINDSHFARYEVRLNNDLLYSSKGILNGETNLNIAGYNGNCLLRINAYDTAGNSSTVVRSLNIDNNPPVTKVFIGSTPFENAVYRSNNTNYVNGNTYLTLQAESGDSFSTVVDTFVSIDGGAFVPLKVLHFDNGYHTISYYSVDNIGNTETPKTISLMVDDTPPSISHQVSMPYYQDSSYTFVPFDNQIKLTASDLFSGVSLIYYSVDNGMSYKIYSSFTSGLLLDKPGENEIMYFAIDNVGNTSVTNRLVLFLDPVPPITVLKYNGMYIERDNIYYKGILTNTLSASDFGCGVYKTLYKVDNSSYTEAPEIFYINSDKLSLGYYSMDFLSNCEMEYQKTFIKDEEYPLSTISIEGIAYTNLSIYISPVSLIRIDSVDTKSGIESIFYSINGCPEEIYSNSIRLNEETNRIDYYALDRLSNYEPTNTTVIIKDGDAPKSEVVFLSGRHVEKDGFIYCSSGSIIAIRSVDRLSGVKETIADTNGIVISSNCIEIVGAGDYTLNFYSIDNVGNKEEKHTLTIVSPIPDTLPPELTLSYDGITYFTNQILFGSPLLKISINAIDKSAEGEFPSGVSNITYSLNGIWQTVLSDRVIFQPVSGWNYIRYFAVDEMNNVSATNDFSIFIDSETPVTWSVNLPGEWTNSFFEFCFNSMDKPDELNSGISNTYIIYNGTEFPGISIFIKNEGTNYISYYSIDNIGNREAVNSVQALIDITPPEIVFSGVTEGTIYGSAYNNSNGVVPFVEIKDYISGLKSVQIEILRNETIYFSFVTNEINNSFFSYLLRAIKEEGFYRISCQAMDFAGNLSAGSISFSIDTTPPDLPACLRHLYDGWNVYLEWDRVTNEDVSFYELFRDDVSFSAQTNTYYIDKNPFGNLHKYKVRSIDKTGNESDFSSNDIVNTSGDIYFVYPSTNYHYFNTALLIWASYKGKERIDKEFLYAINRLNLSDPPTLSNISIEVEDCDNKHFHRNAFKIPIVIDMALSNSLVPKDFIEIYEKNNNKGKRIRKVLNLTDWEDGSYVLRIKALKTNAIPPEDAVFFGIDNRAPVNYLCVSNMPVLNEDMFLSKNPFDGRQVITLSPEEAKALTLQAFDPVVNGSSSGIKDIYYSLQEVGIHGIYGGMQIPWKKYNGETFSLNTGRYIIWIQSFDKSKSFWEYSSWPNGRTIMLEIEVIHSGASGVKYSILEDPSIILEGVSDYGLYNNSCTISYAIQNARFSSVFLDSHPINDSQESLTVNKKGKHRLRISAVNDKGIVIERDVVFYVR